MSWKTAVWVCVKCLYFARFVTPPCGISEEQELLHAGFSASSVRSEGTHQAYLKWPQGDGSFWGIQKFHSRKVYWRYSTTSNQQLNSHWLPFQIWTQVHLKDFKYSEKVKIFFCLSIQEGKIIIYLTRNIASFYSCSLDDCVLKIIRT